MDGSLQFELRIAVATEQSETSIVARSTPLFERVPILANFRINASKLGRRL
jgi:hypothetical protein